jgi:transcriptional regulator with XRE-family HTH domain
MPTGPLRRAIYSGDHRLRLTARRFGEESRLLRSRAGVSQASIARAIGVDRSTICRLEAGDSSVSNEVRARMAAVLGAELSLGLFPAGSPLIHDAAHARLVEAVLRLRHPTWRARVEVPIPNGGRRSSDIWLERAGEVVLVEVESHLHVLEAIIREGAEKRALVERAGGDRRIYVALVLPPTRHHRAVVAEHPDTIKTAYPSPPAEIRRALATESLPWPGDGILWIGAPPSARLSSA